MQECPFCYANANPGDDFNCLKEVCAWWDSDNDCCAVLTLAKGLNRAVNEEFGGRSE